MQRSSRPPETDPDAVRMSLGEHLEELRWCLLRALIALVVACLLCIWPARYLLEIIARPVILVLRAQGQPDSFLATSPVENLLVYIKVVLVSGLVLSAPYILYQFWSFVGAGLYRHEKAWVYRIFPLSVGLFVVGVLFMYGFVLLVSLNFLVGFSGWLPLPTAQPNAFERLLLHTPAPLHPESQPGDPAGPSLPLVDRDPTDAPPGAAWVNVVEHKLKVQYPDNRTYSFQLVRDDRRALVTTHFRIGEYLSFVLVLTIAFGLAFQTPLVVLFLARSGLVPAETLRRYRKVVILIIVFIAGILAPPDLLSHILLSGPMILLFELGLWLASRGSREGERDSDQAAPPAPGAAM
ncbi:MAG: twin-arginine translocase subunit TatC [Phycisphaerales bacterium]|nr:twin-arginine translocase subunit TatC [Phycisphaerales bacterium]